MTERNEASIPLFGIRADLSATPSLIEGVLEQTYVNVEDVPVEAVYSFPLPTGAVLLEVSCQLGERTLSARVNAKAKAEARYEEAMAEGRSAMLLKETAPNLYTVSVGQLQPHAVAVLKYRYAQLPVWNGRSLRLRLPTVVAERYGDPADAGFEPWETPSSSIHAEYGFALKLTLSQGLEACTATSPTHRDKIAVEAGEGAATVRIEGAVADRDCVVLLELAQDAPEPAPVTVISEADGEGEICLATVHVPGGGREDPLNLEVVVDCSGSMSGDSIFQAKKGLLCLLEELRPRDRFNLTCFGSGHRSMAEQTIPADPAGIGRAMAFVAGIEADMGGTELASALEAVASRCKASRHGESDRTDILLLTDGAVWDVKDWGANLAKAGCRVFSLGVGSAVSADVLERLAKGTRGAVELATPSEGMNQAVLRLFRSMRRFPETRDVSWPGSPEWVFPEAPVPCFGGDTLYFFARYAGKAEGTAAVTGGACASALLPAPAPRAEAAGRAGMSVLARLGAARLLAGIGEAERGEALALRYSLVSPWTSAVMVDEAEDAAHPGQMPELRQVPQMPAAGQFGAGSVLGAAAPGLNVKQASTFYFADPGLGRGASHCSSDRVYSRPESGGVIARLAKKLLPGRRRDAGAGKTFVCEESSMPSCPAPEVAFQERIRRLARLCKALAVNAGLPAGQRMQLATFQDLVQAGLPAPWLQLLQSIAAQGYAERHVACVFLWLFARESGMALPEDLKKAFGEVAAEDANAIEKALFSGAPSL